MKVCFETFGCRLNKAEALQMEAEYAAKGWEITDSHSEADLFVVRGCSVTRRAQYACEKLIAHLRRKYPRSQIRICGCLETRGVPASVESKPSPAAVPTRTARAYLKVQDGCSGKCSFCIVPKFRGASRSVPFGETMDAAKRFIGAGYREIVVTGCNLSLYASAGRRLPELVAALAELDSGCRIRLGSLEPGDCALDAIHALAGHANCCRFLHLPVQSGSNRILSAMYRPYAIRTIEELVRTAIRLMPGMGLGCDLIAGFPGETESDFEATRSLLRRLPFNLAHVFPYSERPGTLAATMPDAVPKPIRSARARELARLALDNRAKFMRSMVGKTVEVVVESGSRISGWTGEYLRCEAEGSAPRKSIVRIAVTGAVEERLTGRVLPD